MSSRTKIIFMIVGGIAILGGLATLIATGGKNSDDLPTRIITVVAPTEGTVITINGKTVKEGAIDLAPGKYEVVFNRDGFTGQSRTVILQKNQTTTVSVILFGNTPETIDWYSTHANDARKAEGISGSQAGATYESAASKLPLLEELPYVSSGRYEIGFGRSVKSPDDLSVKAIYINYKTEPDKLAAQNWIRYRGYDPDKLEIIYSNTYTGAR